MQAFLLRTFRFLFYPLAAWLNKALGKKVYWALALILSVAAALDLGHFHYTGGMQKTTFDTMMRNRLLHPPADPDIVIVDINEASLSAMSKDYGRWPWPRQVLGEFVENVEKQNPKAIVFDILFSDPDVYNPDSDTYFNDVIKGTDNTYFPILRLPQQSDTASRLKPSAIPGVKPIPGAAQNNANIAMILPYFPAALESGRLGTHNIYVQDDSIARRYIVQRNEYGWSVPSLPARLAQSLGKPLPGGEDMLINWRGPPFTYHTVSFSDVYLDFLNQHRTRSADEFKGKIVIIGSTAPSLFDIKATPMAQLHPGVEILATAIDNLKNRDYLKEQPTWVTILISTVFIWAAATAFYYRKANHTFDKAFGAIQLGFMGLSYAALNLSSYYIDMTAPVTIVLLYFSVARSYAYFSDEILKGEQLFMVGPAPGQHCRLDILMFYWESLSAMHKKQLEEVLADIMDASALHASRVNWFSADKDIFGKMFQNTLMIYWLTDERTSNNALEADISKVRKGILDAATAIGCDISVHDQSGQFTGTPDDAWKHEARRIVAQALLNTTERRQIA